MELDQTATPSRAKSASPLCPEVDVYLSLLVLIHLLDTKKGEQALQCANLLMAKIDSHNRFVMWGAGGSILIIIIVIIIIISAKK